MEKLGHKHIVHNYGHGGSGWSLSWGSSTLALRVAQTTGARSSELIGCGALGLTPTRLALRAGMKVTIYAKALSGNPIEWFDSYALFQDDTIIPVRGQTARLISQTEVT